MIHTKHEQKSESQKGLHLAAVLEAAQTHTTRTEAAAQRKWISGMLPNRRKWTERLGHRIEHYKQKTVSYEGPIETEMCSTDEEQRPPMQSLVPWQREENTSRINPGAVWGWRYRKKSARGNSVSEKTKPESEQAGHCVTQKKTKSTSSSGTADPRSAEFTRQQNLKWKQVTAQEFQQQQNRIKRKTSLC
jgi:hypothetical protein